ncbi:mechanosensitive ion channel family protein [Pectinatus brassicae]|uniref:Small-conductance mechanosensitive channel n=1 Tax=Pectinatus brassicae TaxID=862415 RepID=A0A840UQM8_9FIRM|nr:mechanosensitive ion channel domain-containing protein [Pectinatus brassicae]MBB5337018.1 small-conductance mechanosensitive channel [Pectinatus brassicae]
MIPSTILNEWHYWIQLLIVPFFIQVAAFLLGKMINNFIKRKLHGYINKDTFSAIFANAVQGLPVAWCSGIGLYLSINSIKFINSTITLLLSSLLYTVIVLSLTRVFSRAVSGILELKIKRGNENLQATSLLTNIISFIIYAVGIIIILQYLGISVTPLLTALGVGGMAVALGLQDTLANIFSGLHIILSKQLQIYDFVKLSNGETGQVVDITWRFTKIQTPSNNIIIVPNKDIASTTITNYNMPKEAVSFYLTIGISYDSDLDLVEQVTIDTARSVLDKIEHHIDYDPVIRFFEFADSSINFNVILKTNVFLNQYLIKHEFIKALTKRYRQENIDIPFPIRTIINDKQK